MTFRERAAIAAMQGYLATGEGCFLNDCLHDADDLARVCCERWGHEWNSHNVQGGPDAAGTFCERCGVKHPGKVGTP